LHYVALSTAFSLAAPRWLRWWDFGFAAGYVFPFTEVAVK
jgi:hypothetical protein